MSRNASARAILSAVWRELRVRGRLLAAAFGKSARLATPVAAPQTDLLNGLNVAGQAAGLQVWDWDLVNDTLQFDRNVMPRYGGDVQAAEADPGAFIARAVHADDLPHYRREFVRALKGEVRLCIDYRVVHNDGSIHPVQLRGEVFRGPPVDGRLGRATRVVGFTVDMRSQIESAQRIAAQTEQQRQLLERLTLATETAGIGVWDWDLKTNRLRADANMAQIFEQADADSFPSAIEFTASIVHADDLAAFNQALENAVRTGERVSHRYRQIHADGTTHHVQLHGRVMRNANNKPHRFLALTADITAQVEAQNKIEQQAQELRQWIERVSLASETAGIGMWDWDLNSGKLSSDSNMATIFKDADLTGVTDAPSFVQKILHPDDRASFTATMREALTRTDIDRVAANFRYLRNDDGIHYVELRGRIVRNASGRADRFLGISWNVTAKVEAQAEIEQQADAQRLLLERLNLATEVAGLDVWDWDLVNDRFTADTHLTRAYGTTHLDVQDARALLPHIIHADDLAGYLTALDRAIASGDTFYYRYRMALRDGTQRHVQAHARVFRNAAGKAVRLLGVTIDATEEVEHVNELRRQAADERTLRDRLNLATETAGIGVWDKDLITGEFVSDEQFWKITGLAPDNRFRPLDAIRAEDRATTLAPLDAAFADPTYTAILAVRHRSSNPRPEPQYLQTHMRVSRDAAGKAIRILGVSWDVTTEALHAEELQRKADQERALVERLNVVTKAARISPWEFDLKTDSFSWHGLRQEIYGLDDVPLDKYRDALAQIVLEEDRHILTSASRHAVENNIDSYNYQFRVRGKDGRIHFMRNIAQLQRNARGRYRYIMGVTMDVTAEVEATEKLRQQSELERKLLDRLSVATQAAGISPWEFDLKTNQYSWIGERLAVLGLDHVPVDDYYTALKNILLPEDVNNLHDAAREAIINDINAYSARYRARGTDNQVHHLKNFVRVLRSPRGTAYRLIGVTWDISEEVAASALLEQRAEENRKLIERLNIATSAANIASWEIDLVAARFLWIENPIQHVERGADDRISLADFAQFIVPEDRTIMPNAIRNAVAAGSDRMGFRYRAYSNDKQIVHLQTFARLICDERGRPIRVLGVTWDVTKEVQATEQLRSQAELERALVDRLNVATQAAGISPWEFDLKTNSFMWFGIRLTVLGLDDVPLDSYFDALRAVVLPEDRHILVDAPSAALKSGVDVYSYRYRANGTDGNVHYLKNYVRILRSPRGTPYRLVGVTWNISEEVAANERLAQEVQHAQTLKERLGIATMAAGISPFEIDLTTGKFLWVENPIKALSGKRGGDNALTTFSQRIHPDDVNNFRDEIVRAAKGGYDLITYRYRGLANDGSIVHVQTHAKLYFNEQRRATRALGVSWDVTKEFEAAARLHTQAEHERKLIERLNIATDSAGISSWEIDLVAGQFLWIENPIKTVEHDDDNDLDLARFTERILPEDRGTMNSAMLTALQANSDRIAFRYRAIGRDGGTVHVQTFARIILSDAQTPVRVLGVSWDVTHEVQAAEQLRHQTERLRDAERRLERASLSSSEGHWEAELATGHLWCSSSFHTLLGYLEGELESRVNAFDRLVHADDRAAYHDALRKHLVNNLAYDVQARMRMANGEYRWFRMRGMAERNTEGQATVMAGSIHDVHQQKLAEDALALAQRRFERAINGTQDGLWEVDVASNDVWVSPRLALLLGYSTAQLQNGNFLLTLMHAEDAPKVTKVTESHYRHNTPFDLELRLRMQNGEYRWYRARASAERDTNGRAVRLSGSLQDVTEARAAREELVRATEAAEAASRAKSAFLANVSHEIRTPMNGIIGMTGLLLDTSLDRIQLDYANTIRGSADSLLTVINDILDFSKIEAGKLDLENIELDLRANVEDVGAMMAFQAANKGLELIINVHPEVPEYVLGDPQRIRQCLINLVGNAIKFTKRGEVVVDVCAVGRHEGRVLTHFEVRDTGMGIAEDTLITLFQPFVQADSSTTRHFGGTGLGLSIVRRLVEMMGGKVGVVSKLGEGSAFFFTLSLQPREGELSLPPTVPRSSTGRILLVDDNATNRRVLDTLLTHHGYRVVQAESGAEALRQLQSAASKRTRETAVDMVITDFQMPDMDGIALGESIASDPLLTNLRLVMLTSLDRQGDGKRLAALGFAAYLTKPVRTRELLDCVAHVLSGEARQWQMEMRPMITRNSLSQSNAQQRFCAHVLLVEDNAVNQKVAARFLERMGCTVRIAEHGADAVAAYATEKFDIIMMDLQMPVMDGLTAARKIRELESVQNPPRRTPIVALTANAMRGDQERCESAGMDGFLTKPIEIERLRDTLLKFGLADNTRRAASRHAAMGLSAVNEQPTLSGAAPPIDLARLNEITGGDAEFAKELVDTFVASGEAQVTEIHAAIVAGDRDALARAAHKLKGACANIHAEYVRSITSSLEAEALTASVAQLQNYDGELQREFRRAREFLSHPGVVPAAVKAAS